MTSRASQELKRVYMPGGGFMMKSNVLLHHDGPIPVGGGLITDSLRYGTVGHIF